MKKKYVIRTTRRSRNHRFRRLSEPCYICRPLRTCNLSVALWEQVPITYIIICTVFLVIALIFLAVCLWYFSPVSFLQGVEENRVSSISVFDGSTGKKMVIEDREEINTIVGNIQSLKLKRNGLSINYVGFSFSLSFKDKDGNVIDSIVINSKDTIRDSQFFYKCESGEICFAYLLELADRYCAE